MTKVFAKILIFIRIFHVDTRRNNVNWCGFSIWKLTSNRVEFLWWEAVWCGFYCGFLMNFHQTHAKKDTYFTYSFTREKRYIEEKLMLSKKLSNKLLIMLLIMLLIKLLIKLLIMLLIMLLIILLIMSLIMLAIMLAIKLAIMLAIMLAIRLAVE